MNQVEKIFSENKSPLGFAHSYLKYLSGLLLQLDEAKIAEIIEIILQAREEGRQIFFIGNGGSAATASHFANDIAIGTREYKKPFRAISLTDNVPVLTAIGNDNGYDEIFKKQLEVLMNPKDVVVAISASGNSPNLIKALEYANEKGAKTVGLIGFDGGKMLGLCQTSLHVKTAKGEYGPVEDIHMVMDHLIGNYLYQYVRMNT